MLCMQNDEKIDLINSQKGVLHWLFGAEGHARCHWESNLLEGCQSAGFGFDFLRYSRLSHIVCTRSCCPSGVWDAQVRVPPLRLQFAVTVGKLLKSSTLSSVFSLNARRTNKLTLSFIIRQFWNWLPEVFTVLQICEWQVLRRKECCVTVAYIEYYGWDDMYVDSLECLRGNRGRRAARFLAFLVFFVVFEKIQLLFLKYRNPAEPTCNGNVLRKWVERKRWIVQLWSRQGSNCLFPLSTQWKISEAIERNYVCTLT